MKPIIFIIPYRNRHAHKEHFKVYMKYVMQDIPYEVYFIHQTDNRDFNRGAMKNIGFLMIKKRYPDTYKYLTLVFNDVDTIPYTHGILNYETKSGVVKHFYGHKFCLGGSFSITGEDFEKVKGFPNFWSWGYEDNIMYDRVIQNRTLHVDRSVFYKIGHPHILQFFDGIVRSTSRSESKLSNKHNKNNYNSIKNLDYTIVHDIDNIYMVNVNKFDTDYNNNVYSKELTHIKHLQSGPSHKQNAMQMHFK